jgi:ATP-dependent DNA ligase
VPYSALLEPMLAKSGPIQTHDGWTHEVKWDVGFRAVATASTRPCSTRRGKRRQILERIDFNGGAHVPEAFTDGSALFDAVCDSELEGVVAKRLNESYRPGERAWVKTKTGRTGVMSSSAKARSRRTVFGSSSDRQRPQMRKP